LEIAKSADLEDAFARLEGCGADADLLTLTKRCLAAQCEERLADAGAVAETMTAYLANVQKRLQAAEVEKAAAEAQAKAARKGRRWTTLAALVFLVAFGGATYSWFTIRSLQSESNGLLDGWREQLVWRTVATPNLDISEYKNALDIMNIRYSPDYTYSLTTEAAAHYHVGQFAEVLQTLEKRLQRKSCSPAQLAILAMAYARLDQRDQARAALEEARRLVAEEDKADDPRMIHNTGYVQARVLLREAEETVAATLK
jgi:hypothetical protein